MATAAQRQRAGAPTALLLLPTALERFILRDQARDLLRAPGAVAVQPPRVRYGAFGRLPWALGNAIARVLARRIVRGVRDDGAEPRVVVIFHVLQYQLARAVIDAAPGCELWYWRWDRYERAYDASPAMRARLTRLHEAAAGDAARIVAVSDELVRQELEAGRDAVLVPLAADAFPAVPDAEVVAISLGHLGWRTDWALLRAVSEQLGDRFVLLLVGAVHPDECRADRDFEYCRQAPNIVWLGAQPDEAAARLITCADVGIVPFAPDPFNDAALPYRIIKYARLGRATVAPPLGGLSTWSRAVTVADGPERFSAALLEHAGRRREPDVELRAWALAQTASSQDAPLWERLREVGVDIGGTTAPRVPAAPRES